MVNDEDDRSVDRSIDRGTMRLVGWTGRFGRSVGRSLGRSVGRTQWSVGRPQWSIASDDDDELEDELEKGERRQGTTGEAKGKTRRRRTRTSSTTPTPTPTPRTTRTNASSRMRENEDEDEDARARARGRAFEAMTFKHITLTYDDEDEGEDEKGMENVKALCATCIEGWRCGATLRVTRVSGGITNALFKVTASGTTDDGTPRAVVVRVFGRGTETFITHRATQGETSYYLNEYGFGAKILGVFANGLVEEFIDATAVSPAELANGGALLKRVARDLARLHRDVAPDLPPRAKDLGVKAARANAIWDTLSVWFDMARDIAADASAKDRNKVAALASCRIDDACRRTLFDVVRARCDDAKSVTVFCHNDIHAGNFLFDRKNDVLTLIDYEYADYGPRAFDMANMFCEFAGFECDYSRYPTAGLRREFYKAYASEPEEAQALETEVAAWTPVAHAFWALWAIIQSKFSSIDFDFAGFAAIRMTAFRASAMDASKWVPTNDAVWRNGVCGSAVLAEE